MIQEFILQTVKALVNTPDEVTIDRKADEMGVLYTIKVKEGEGGMVIGKQGKVADSLRTIMRNIGMKHGERVNIKLDF